MKIRRIFADQDFLLSAHWDGQILDEFSRIFDCWTDIGFLENFFTEHEKDLHAPFWKGITIEEAVFSTRGSAIKFRNTFKDLVTESENCRVSFFRTLFRPLYPDGGRLVVLSKNKAYGAVERSWLRIYAIKIGVDMYIITGGAIKLTQVMEERAHTLQELTKLDMCREFLKAEGIFDEEGMLEFLEIEI
jgi:hypothetical protein